MPQIRIGTSGWHYPHWIGCYYPEDTRPAAMLDYYLRDFDTVELNNTFYQLPKESTFDSWRDAVPRDFRFAVKGSRFLTHMLKLKDPARGIRNFIPRVRRLGPKLGPILWQLPPRWKVNAGRLEEFLWALPRGIRYAFELRDGTWMTDAVFDILHRHGAAFCIYELAGYQSPLEITTSWTYVRLHGPARHAYAGSYPVARLTAWAKRIRSWSHRLDAVYVYFDNDQAAYAVKNALTLKRITGASRRRRAARESAGASSRSR